MTFSHLDPGTDEDVWADAFRSAAVPRSEVSFASLLVVSAHPDDETLGVGGLLRVAARRGAQVLVLIATDGEGSHPRSGTHTPQELAAIRRAEVATAMEILAPAAEVRFLGLPDGGLTEHPEALADTVRDGIRSLPRPTLVVSPWSGDGHRDHRIAAEASAAASRAEGALYRGYPIWLWHWGTAADAPWERMERVVLDEDTRSLKQRALHAHRSQSTALSRAPGDEPVLHPAMLRHFDRAFEVLIADPSAAAPPAEEIASPAPAPTSGSTPRSWFDGFYDRNDDPWGFDTRWYEVRKRRLLLASLPRERYATALELGCATGALTIRLADRADRVLAVDFSQTALDAARERLSELAGVELRRADLPHEWPAGRFDLVVFSELGYYWDAVDLEDAIGRMVGSLSPGGHLVACHWRHPVPENPVTGDGVHVALRTRSDLVTVAHHEEEDFVLEVFARPPARSVAAETGLVS